MTRLLIVEDDAVLAASLVELLRLDGYEAQSVQNGQAALDVLETEQPDAIISDVLMPEMGGLQLKNIVRDSPQWGDIPFILMSGLSSHQPDIHSAEREADFFINKPFDYDLFTEVVSVVLDTRLPATA